MKVFFAFLLTLHSFFTFFTLQFSSFKLSCNRLHFNAPIIRSFPHKTILKAKNFLENENEDENLPLPPWVHEVGKKKVLKYKPVKYEFKVYEEYFNKLCAEKKAEIAKYQPPKTQEEKSGKHGGSQSYGFKIKQIQPLKYHQGNVYTFFYMHMLDMSIAPILLNSFRRVLLEFTHAGRCTALRIEGMKHEFYSIVGVREDFFDISNNLRKVVFKNVPKVCDMDNAVYARFRVKGPMIVTAGQMQFFRRTVYTAVRDDFYLFQSEVGRYNYSSSEYRSVFGDNTVNSCAANDSSVLHLKKEDQKMKGSIEIAEEAIRKIKIINPNRYICSVAAGSYLCMDVKIENIYSYVMPEAGPDSLNRDIDINNFIHFSSSATPVSLFGFQGERKGISRNELTEINTIEMHTDGSITPRLALLNACNILLSNFYKMHFALHFNTRIGKDGTYEILTEDPEILDDSDRFQGVPWNPWKTPEQRRKEKEEFFADRSKIKRQTKIDPESEEAKKELREEFYAKLKLKKEIEERQIIKKDIHEYFDSYEPHLEGTDKNVHNPPDWVVKGQVPPAHCGGAKLPFYRIPPIDD